MRQTAHSPAPAIRRISTADIWLSCARACDFEAYRSERDLPLAPTPSWRGAGAIDFGSSFASCFPLAQGKPDIGGGNPPDRRRRRMRRLAHMSTERPTASAHGRRRRVAPRSIRWDFGLWAWLTPVVAGHHGLAAGS